MSRRLVFAVLWGVALLVFAISEASTDAAELRTTASGRPLVRRLSYQAQPEKGANGPSMAAVPPLPDDFSGGVSDYAEDGWDGSCDDRYFFPFAATGDYWVSFEFLLWWRRGDDMPPLVTTSPVGTPVGSAGVLGLSTTTPVTERSPCRGIR